jgi:hypothetical protein
MSGVSSLVTSTCSSPDCQRKHWNRGHKTECQPKNAEAIGANGHIGKPNRKAPLQAAVVNGNALAKRVSASRADRISEVFVAHGLALVERCMVPLNSKRFSNH